MNPTKIEWATHTWNPARGCSPKSAGCENCYAAVMAKRLGRIAHSGYSPDDSFRVTLCENKLEEPLHVRKPSVVFVCSMGDLFHPDVPFEFVDKVMAVVALCPHHRFVVLTKRPERLREYMSRLMMPNQVTKAYMEMMQNGLGDQDFVRAANAAGEYNYQHGRPGFVDPWPLSHLVLGVSIEDQPTANARVLPLQQTPAATRILSVEPMLGPINLTRLEHKSGGAFINAFTGKAAVPGQVIYAGEPIDGVIVGGETGPQARHMDPKWARSIRDQCRVAGVPFFMKQMTRKVPIPEDLMIRELPESMRAA